MQILRMDGVERAALLASLAAMPDWLEAQVAGLDTTRQRQRVAGQGFSAIEQVWHLADLEAEGYGLRIRRLRDEHSPQLADFDGDAVAAARDYQSRDLDTGLVRFRAARLANLQALQALDAAQWPLAGEQQGVGAVSLCDVPAMMAGHDAGHRAEIAEWLAATAGVHSG